ncbi:MAG: B12-binding domain-containing radical SAM protein [Nitrospirae bacterium]|nr:B12-binding domain-containing radical SAM protein [Nitrospirota bacterium]
MNICLIGMGYSSPDIDNFDYSLGLAYIQAYLQQKFQNETKVTNLYFHSDRLGTYKKLALLHEILKTEPDVAAFSCHCWNMETLLSITGLLKDIRPGITIIVGGPDPTFRAIQLMERYPAIDIIIKGEGEEVFTEIIGRFLNNSDYQAVMADIHGIVFRKNGSLYDNVGINIVEDLNKLPSPYLTGVIDLDNESVRRHVSIETYRGCPFSCSYCNYNRGSRRVRYFPPDRIEKELSYLLGRGVENLFVMDPTFNHDVSRCATILNYLKKYNRSTLIHIEARGELFTDEMIDSMVEAGITLVELGIQTISESNAAQMNRQHNIAKIERNIALLNKKNIHVVLHVMGGLPDETIEDLTDTIEWCVLQKPATIVVFPTGAFPGTILKQEQERFGLVCDPEPFYYVLKSPTLSVHDMWLIDEIGKVLNLSYAHGYGTFFYALKIRCGCNAMDFIKVFIEKFHTADWRNNLYHFLEKTLDMLLAYYEVDSMYERELLSNVLRYIHVRSLLNESIHSYDSPESLKDMELSFSDKARLVRFPFNVRQFIDDLSNGGAGNADGYRDTINLVLYRTGNKITQWKVSDRLYVMFSLLSRQRTIEQIRSLHDSPDLDDFLKNCVQQGIVECNDGRA